MPVRTYPHLASLTLLWLTFVSTVSTADAPASLASSHQVIAQLKGRELTLDEVDNAGGRAVYDAAQALYEARVRALYQLLSDEVIAREAKEQHRTVEELIEREVNNEATAATDEDVDAFLKAHSDQATDNPKARREAQLYLNLKRRADRKRAYVESLFDRYNVRVSLEGPPSAPIEEVHGALSPAIGPDDAPVTLIVFSDYLCPYCRSLSHTLEKLTARFPKQVRIVYRHFPTHKKAQPLAAAALCAADQGRFLPFHQELFALQGEASEQLEPAAQRAGLDLASFRECVQSDRHTARIAEDVKEAQRLQIQGTPTLFLNGVRLRGAQSLERLEASVKEALGAPRNLASR